MESSEFFIILRPYIIVFHKIVVLGWVMKSPTGWTGQRDPMIRDCGFLYFSELSVPASLANDRGEINYFRTIIYLQLPHGKVRIY